MTGLILLAAGLSKVSQHETPRDDTQIVALFFPNIGDDAVVWVWDSGIGFLKRTNKCRVTTLMRLIYACIVVVGELMDPRKICRCQEVKLVSSKETSRHDRTKREKDCRRYSVDSRRLSTMTGVIHL